MLQFSSGPSKSFARPGKRSAKKAFKNYILTNYGKDYVHCCSCLKEKRQQKRDEEVTTVGIVGGGFGGLFAGILLRSVGLECEIFESTDRVGGRIYTWYSDDIKDHKFRYGEVGGMRLPQFSDDMLPVQHLALCVNSVLERAQLKEQEVVWRKFYYASETGHLRYNNMEKPAIDKDKPYKFNFNKSAGGDIPDAWFEVVNGDAAINQVLAVIQEPFTKAFDISFELAFEKLMKFDQYSMWSYLTTVFRLGDLGQYYHPKLGSRNDFLPWSVASYLETTQVGTGMYGVSFVEMVIAQYDWGGSHDPYRPGDDSIYMLTVDGGMQRFPDACRTILDLDDSFVVTMDEGIKAQEYLGLKMTKGEDKYTYNPPNLTDDAQPLPPKGKCSSSGSSSSSSSSSSSCGSSSKKEGGKQRVKMNTKVTRIRKNESGGVNVTVRPDGGVEETKSYPFVIATLPFGNYVNGEKPTSNEEGSGVMLHDLSFDKATALRETHYMPAFKAFITFKKQFWAPDGSGRQETNWRGGTGATDRPMRQIVYPSYGYEEEEGVLQVYCWAQDARRLGALSDEERVNECLKGIKYLYPEVDVLDLFAGYQDGVTTKTWFWDDVAGSGAFALYSPGQFEKLYATLLTPEYDGALNFAGEAVSVHHGWIVGALDSAVNAVENILNQLPNGAELLNKLAATWGDFVAPDVASPLHPPLEYSFQYNEVDRKASSGPPGPDNQPGKSIYGDSDFVFEGDMPPLVRDYGTVPDAMKRTQRDTEVKDLLNRQWDDNVSLRSAKPALPAIPIGDDVAGYLEYMYYGGPEKINFLATPAPLFWLKDDREFARQQVAGFMNNVLELNSCEKKADLVKRIGENKLIESATYVADYQQYLKAVTVTPTAFYMPQPVIFFNVVDKQLVPTAIYLDKCPGGIPWFTPDMCNANAWLCAKMLANCAGQTLHDVGYHQLLTHQQCVVMSIALFSPSVFQWGERGGLPKHNVFKLLRTHVVKAIDFQQSDIYNNEYQPYNKGFPFTREAQGKPGVYQLGFIYDLIFSCGRIGNYQLQDYMYNHEHFKFLNMDIHKDLERRGVAKTDFSYPYRDDSLLWHKEISNFVAEFVKNEYKDDAAVAGDAELQRFFAKVTEGFNHSNRDPKSTVERFPSEVKTTDLLSQVLTQIIFQYSVQHTVVNDGAYNQAAFTPNASTLMLSPPDKPNTEWTPIDVVNCLPPFADINPALNMNFADIQLNASVTGQGPYHETYFGRLSANYLQPNYDALQDSYDFGDPKLRKAVDNFFGGIRRVGEGIKRRQNRDVAEYLQRNDGGEVPETVKFDLVTPEKVMNTVQA